MKIDRSRMNVSSPKTDMPCPQEPRGADLFGQESFEKTDMAAGVRFGAADALKLMKKGGECGLRTRAFFNCGEAHSMSVNRERGIAYIDLRGGSGKFYDLNKGTMSPVWVGSASGKVPVGPDGQLYGSERLSVGIKAFDGTTGEEKWSFSPGYKAGLFHSGIYMAAVAQDGSPIAIGNQQLKGATYGYEMIALDQNTGAVRWKVDLCEGNNISPVQMGRNTLIADRKPDKGNSTMLGIDSKTGKIRWKEKLEYPLSAQAPAVKDEKGRLLVAGQGRIFEFDENGLKGSMEVDGLGDAWIHAMELRPDLGDNLLLASTYRHGFFTIDRTTGKIVTSYKDAPASGRFFKGQEGLAYATGESSGHQSVVVMDEKSGRKLWNHEAAFVEIESIGVSPAGDIYISNSAGPLTRLDPKTGKPTELFSIDTEKYGAPKRILAFSDDSTVMFLSTEKGIMLVDMRALSVIAGEHPEVLERNGSEKIVRDDDCIFIDGLKLDVQKWNKCSL